MEMFLGGTNSQLDFYNANAMIYSGYENQMNILSSWLWESKQSCDDQIPVLQDLRKKLEDEAINTNKPQRKLAIYTDNSTNTLSSRSPSPSLKTDDTPSKHGYLFMKPLNGKGTWTRKYFYLQDGIFWWVSVGQGKQRAIIEESERIGVLLCEIRVDTLQERRFCFEIVCGAKSTSWVLQAETESELKDWIASFESAKRHAFSSSNDLASSAAAAVSSHKEPGDDTNQSATEEGEYSNDDLASPPKPGDENSQNDSLEPSTSEPRRTSVNNMNVIGKRHSISASSTITPGIRQSPYHSHTLPLRNQSSTNTIANTNNSNGSNGSQAISPLNPLTTTTTTASSSTSTNQQNFWGSIQWGIMPAMSMLINSVNGSEGDGDEDGDDFRGKRKLSSKNRGNRSRSGSGPVGSGIDGSIAEYPQTLMSHNLQLHLLFENMSEKEFLLDVYQCGLVKGDNWFRGRVYFTQDRLYFYSVVMSIVNMFCIPWQELKSVTLEATNPQQTVAFSDESGQKYVIKIFLDNRSFYDKARLVWKLATSEKAPSLQSIYDALWKPHTSLSTNEASEEYEEKLIGTSEAEIPYNGRAKDNTSALSSEKYTQELRTQSENGETYGNNGGTFNNFNRDDSHSDFPPEYEKLQSRRKSKDNSSLEAPKPIKPGPVTIQSKEDGDYPLDVTIPKGPVTCGCVDHLDKLEVEAECPVSARKLYQILFDENSSLWERMHEKRRHTLQNVGAWAMNASGERQRELRIIMPINGSASTVNETECIETYTCQRCDDYICYVVLIQTKALQNDSFLSMSKWCITHTTKTSCKLICHIGIKSFKATVSKATRKAATARLSETVADVIELLNADIAHGKPKMLPSSPTRSAPTLRRRIRQHKSRNHPTAIKYAISGEESITGNTGSTNRIQESNAIAPSSSPDDNKFAGAFSSITTILVDLSSNTHLSGFLAVILVLLLASNIYSFVCSESDAEFPACGSMKVVPPAPAVYIRDLEEQVFNMSGGKVLHSVVDPESYSQFLDTRTQYPPYPWLLHSNRRLSEEIGYARKRVAVIRYDLLLTFKLINSIDERLIKSEYVNWLLDERAKCNKAKWMFLRDDMLNEENSAINDKGAEKENESCTGGENDENGESRNDNCESGEGYKEKVDVIGMKRRAEYYSILNYCENVKGQLGAFVNHNHVIQ